MENIKQKVLTGWNFSRILYVVTGSAVLIDSVINRQWVGIIIGACFATMGIFAFGCAAGNCTVKKS